MRIERKLSTAHEWATWRKRPKGTNLDICTDALTMGQRAEGHPELSDKYRAGRKFKKKKKDKKAREKCSELRECPPPPPKKKERKLSRTCIHQLLVIMSQGLSLFVSFLIFPTDAYYYSKRMRNRPLQVTAGLFPACISIIITVVIFLTLRARQFSVRFLSAVIVLLKLCPEYELPLARHLTDFSLTD